MGGGTSSQAAATYLAGWFGGGLAEVVGFGIAAGDCGFLVDGRSARWHVHRHGWPTAVDIAPRAVVASGHPWEGLAGVEVGEPDGRAVAALVDACEPIVDACRGLAKVGRVGLWNEIGDALGNVLAFQSLVPATEARLGRLRHLVDQPGVPWKARVRLAFASSEVLGSVHVSQKGGCCLAYTCDGADPGDPYCMTCSFRDPEECDGQQVAWVERRHAERTGDPPASLAES